MKKLSFILFAFLLFVMAPSSTLAFNRGLVLGEATTTAQEVSPPGGSGVLLPDSPFYFIDVWRDRLRTLLTTNAEDRVRLGMKIAAERLAELQIMLQRENPQGINRALENLTTQIEQSRRVLQTERARGREVAALAHDLNEAIDQDQEFLAKIQEKSRPEAKFLLRVAQARIAQVETEVEDELPEQEKENEEIEELNQGLEEEIQEASESTRKAEHLASQATERLRKIQEREGKKSQEASRAANKLEEKMREARQRARQKANEALEKALKATRRTIEETRSAAENVERVHQEELRESAD